MRWVLISVLVAGYAGADKEQPAPPPTVAQLDPCTMLTAQEQDHMHVRVSSHEEHGPRRTCTFDLDDTVGYDRQAIYLLEITIRDSPAPNQIADAKRVAETYQRERDTTLTRTKLGGRDVYQVGPATGIGCPWLFQVNATSSVEVAETGFDGGPRCADPALPGLIAAKLPAPDPTPPRPDHDRPASVLDLKPCLLSDAKRTAWHLDQGRTDDDAQLSCYYFGGASSSEPVQASIVPQTTDGALSGTGGQARPTRTINGRDAYEERDIGAANCYLTLAVTPATSVRVTVSMADLMADDKACRFATQLATDIEPRLPLIVS